MRGLPGCRLLFCVKAVPFLIFFIHIIHNSFHGLMPFLASPQKECTIPENSSTQNCEKKGICILYIFSGFLQEKLLYLPISKFIHQLVHIVHKGMETRKYHLFHRWMWTRKLCFFGFSCAMITTLKKKSDGLKPFRYKTVKG